MDKITNIVSVGCSWVAYPYDWDEKYRLDKINPDISKFKDETILKNYSFTKYLAEKLDVPYYNIGSPGASNDYVFNSLFQLVNQKKLQNSFVVVGLTEPTRHQIGVSPTFNISKNGAPWGWKKTFFNDFYSEEARIRYIMMMLDLFNEYLKNKNSKFVVFNSFTEEISYPKRDYFFNKFATWEDYIVSYDKDYHRNTHPINYDHKILANLLYEEYFCG